MPTHRKWHLAGKGQWENVRDNVDVFFFLMSSSTLLNSKCWRLISWPTRGNGFNINITDTSLQLTDVWIYKYTAEFGGRPTALGINTVQQTQIWS